MHQKFLEICREEHKLKIVLKPLRDTLWIYVPLDDDLLEVSSTLKGMLKSDTAQERPTVKYLKSIYSNRHFEITYDVRPDKNYPQSPGYGLGYSSTYQKVSQQILTGVSRAYFEPADVPQFFVTVIADVKKGIEIENIFFLDDLKRYMAFGALPQEEFLKRSIYESRGKSEWIGDTEGRHLAYTEITMPDFLAKQMATRINFKYQTSSFPPSDDARQELLQIAAQTISAYNFTDFTALRLHDLSTDSVETISPEQLKAFASDETPSAPGRLINIRVE
jgi:hypothetical protein